MVAEGDEVVVIVEGNDAFGVGLRDGKETTKYVTDPEPNVKKTMLDKYSARLNTHTHTHSSSHLAPNLLSNPSNKT